MRVLKIFLITSVSTIVILGAAAAVYLAMNLQGEAEPFEINTPDAGTKVLVATQGSGFKDALRVALEDRLKAKPVYVKGVDLSALAGMTEANWDGVVIIHAVQMWQAPKPVMAFLARAGDLRKVLLVATSLSGEWKMRGYDVDTITSASRKGEVSRVAGELERSVDAILVMSALAD